MEFYAPYRRQPGVLIPNWLLARKIQPGSKMLYGRLCGYCGRNSPDKCWPKVETLARELGYGKRQIQRYLAELEKAGLIVVDRHPRRSSIYRFPEHPWMNDEGPMPSNPGDPPEDETEPEMTPQTASDSGVTHKTPQGRHTSHSRRDTCDTPGGPLSSSLEYRSLNKSGGKPPAASSVPSGLSGFRTRFDEAWSRKYGDVRPHDRLDSRHAREVYDAAVDACNRAPGGADDAAVATRLDKWIASFLALQGWADDQRHNLWAMSRSISRLVEPVPVKIRYKESPPEPKPDIVDPATYFETMKKAANGELAPPPLMQRELFEEP